MENKDFTTTILVDNSPQEVFNAIKNVRGWWSKNIEGKTDEQNAEFFYHNKDAHLCKVLISELKPNEKVSWFIKDNYFSFVEDKTEWKGTKINFDIYKKDDKTQLTFTHQGLVPEYKCYEICDDAWKMFIGKSLSDLITTGKGQPLPKETEGYGTKMVDKWKTE